LVGESQKYLAGLFIGLLMELLPIRFTLLFNCDKDEKEVAIIVGKGRADGDEGVP
jgi:hypothetical protein